MRDFSLKFLTRAGSHLCDDARPLVEWACVKAVVEVEEIDIDTDDRLTALYALRIPVLLDPEGGVIAEGIIEDRRAILKELRRLKNS